MFRLTLAALCFSLILLVPAVRAVDRDSAEARAGKTPAPAELMERQGMPLSPCQK